MDIQVISGNVLSPSAQKVTEVTQRVEGGDPKSSIGENVGSSVANQVNGQPAIQMSANLTSQIDKLNQTLERAGQSITFGIDESTQSPVIQVKDRSTDELIRQLPSEDSLKMMQQIQDYLDRAQQTGGLQKEGLTGNLFNEII